MKNVSVLLVLLTCNLGFSQVKKELGDFDTVKVFDRISVELVQSSENKIEISGNRADEVEVLNKNGDLVVRMPLKKLLDGEEITAKLYFKTLESIDASEGSYVIGDETLQQTYIRVNAKEGAEVRLKIAVDKADLRVVTGGILKITGSATNQDIMVGTGGIIRANNLSTKQTKVTITTGGEADVRATDLVDAKVRAGGTVTIFGKPRQIIKKIRLGGSIDENQL